MNNENDDKNNKKEYSNKKKLFDKIYMKQKQEFNKVFKLIEEKINLMKDLFEKEVNEINNAIFNEDLENSSNQIINFVGNSIKEINDNSDNLIILNKADKTKELLENNYYSPNLEPKTNFMPILKIDEKSNENEENIINEENEVEENEENEEEKVIEIDNNGVYNNYRLIEPEKNEENIEQ